VAQMKVDIRLVLARQANDGIIQLNTAQLEQNAGTHIFVSRQKEVCCLSVSPISDVRSCQSPRS
jgi:hypothetical protein